MSALQYIQNAVRESPWVHLAVLPPAVVAVLSFAASATPAEQAAVWSLATILGTVGAGLVKRPVHVAVSTAAITTIAGNLATLGLHLPPSATAAVLAVISVLSPAAAQLIPSQQASPVAQITVTPTPTVPPSQQVQQLASPTFPAGF